MDNSKYKNLFEGKFVNTHASQSGFLENLYYSISPSTYIENLMFRYITEYLSSTKTDSKKPIQIIDLGCGGGHKKLTYYGDVHGIDISEASIINSTKIYKSTVVSSLVDKLPFEDNSMDIAFCSEVIGHIAVEDKDKLFSEVKRVVKKDGLIICSVETYGKNILTNTLKKKNLYDEYWINYQGHIGLETPTDTKSRFAKFFNVKHAMPGSNYILAIDGYMIFDDRVKWLKVLKNNLLRRILNIAIMPVYLLSLRLLPFDSANDLVVAAINNK